MEEKTISEMERVYHLPMVVLKLLFIKRMRRSLKRDGVGICRMHVLNKRGIPVETLTFVYVDEGVVCGDECFEGLGSAWAWYETKVAREWRNL